MLLHILTPGAKCAGVDQMDLDCKIGFTTYDVATFSFLTSMATILAGTQQY